MLCLVRAIPGGKKGRSEPTFTGVSRYAAPGIFCPAGSQEPVLSSDPPHRELGSRVAAMSTAVKLQSRDARSIPYQEASLDIWDKKYRLSAKDGTPIDRSMDDTYKRVARALADVELPEVREHWYEQFLWALRRGAIPAGRVTSNAGAQEHKPATSTINCTVSGTIRDSMDDILGKVHEAGLTLKAGCVAPGTWVVTERGVVTADDAVTERHEQILSYDRESGRFEMRR